MTCLVSFLRNAMNFFKLFHDAILVRYVDLRQDASKQTTRMSISRHPEENVDNRRGPGSISQTSPQENEMIDRQSEKAKRGRG